MRISLADRYAVEGELGQGGMATVYLARDLRHNRQVAIKVLRPDLAAAIGAERFLREIEVTANLQHPHILPLYDSGTARGTAERGIAGSSDRTDDPTVARSDVLLYYVMPYVDGESLRARLDREKQLSITDAVRIATEVAEALDYAHRRGIVHRDVKPENVLLHEGRALVADFGIALAVQHAGGSRITQTGLSLGTPQYMSPEQASADRELDARSDVYSLGVMLYEMLAGDPPHAGSTVQAIVASVLTRQPESLASRRATVPSHVAAAVHTALEKLPADRFPTARDFASALRGEGHVPRGVSPAARPYRTWIADGRTWVAVAAATAVTALVVSSLARPSPPRAPVEFMIDLPAEASLAFAGLPYPVAVSADGARIVFSGLAQDSVLGTVSRLFVRTLDRVDPVPIVGTDSAMAPFLAPDGSWVGFWVRGGLRKVPLSGGTPLVLTSAEEASPLRGAVWLGDGSIVYSDGPIGILARLPSAGERPDVLYRDTAFVVGRPAVVPEGDAVVFLRCPVRTVCDETEVVWLDLASHTTRVVLSMKDVRDITPLSDGRLVILRGDGTLASVAYGDGGPSAGGEPVSIRDQVEAFALSPAGTLVAAGRGGSQAGQLVEVRRDGSERPLAAENRNILFPAVSPDGDRVAMEIHQEAEAGVEGHIWVYDLTAHTLTPITSEGHDSRTTWRPDGREVGYASVRGSGSGLYAIAANGEGKERLLRSLSEPIVYSPVFDWSPSGQWIVYSQDGDLFAAVAGADDPPRRLTETAASETRPRFSRDGRWIAYVSNESGRAEVYVRGFPNGGRWKISEGGGTEPAWGPADRELFFRGWDGWLLAARLQLGSDVRVLGRDRLFDASGYSVFGEYSYDAFPDGQRFVFIRRPTAVPRILVALNWVPPDRSAGP